MSLTLHQRAIRDASDNELVSISKLYVTAIVERGLLSPSYHGYAPRIIGNAESNAALKTAGLPHNGVLPV